MTGPDERCLTTPHSQHHLEKVKHLLPSRGCSESCWEDSSGECSVQSSHSSEYVVRCSAPPRGPSEWSTAIAPGLRCPIATAAADRVSTDLRFRGRLRVVLLVVVSHASQSQQSESWQDGRSCRGWMRLCDQRSRDSMTMTGCATASRVCPVRQQSSSWVLSAAC